MMFGYNSPFIKKTTAFRWASMLYTPSMKPIKFRPCSSAMLTSNPLPFASLGQDRAAKLPGFVSFQEMPKALSPSQVACLTAKGKSTYELPVKYAFQN